MLLLLTSLSSQALQALLKVKHFIIHQLLHSRFSLVLKVKPAEEFFKKLLCMLRDAIRSVEAIFVPMQLRTINFKMLTNVLITVLMGTLKVTTTFASPLSFATPLAAAAPAKPKMILPNA